MVVTALCPGCDSANSKVVLPWSQSCYKLVATSVTTWLQGCNHPVTTSSSALFQPGHHGAARKAFLYGNANG